ncbi:MAG: hypothetical protein EOO54_12545 [Haliea sp.]|nr:MAG: hypothetical protein EOO54_12545 [Haliea sp.]
MGGDLPALFEQLATRHYDPAYTRSQRAHFQQWPSRTGLAAPDLSDAGIVQLARAAADMPAMAGRPVDAPADVTAVQSVSAPLVGIRPVKPS